MAAAENGDVVLFYVDNTASTALAVASQTNFSISYAHDEIDTSAKGDTTRTAIPGKVKITGSVEGMYVHTDLAMQRLVTLVESGSQIFVTMFRDGSPWKEADAQLTNLTLTWTDNEASTFSADFGLDGGWTQL